MALKSFKSIEYQGNVNNIDWGVVNALNNIFSFYFNTRSLNIENPFPEINGSELINSLEHEVTQLKKQKIKIDIEEKESIFKWLDKENGVKYYQTLKIFNKILNLSKKEIIEIANILKKQETNIKNTIINSNLEAFKAALLAIISNYGYSFSDNQGMIIVGEDGGKKGEIYQLSSGGFYMKCFSPSLSAMFFNIKNSDTIFPSDILNDAEIKLSDFVDAQKPKNLEKNLKSLKTFSFTIDDNNLFSIIDNIDNFETNDRILLFKNEYNSLSKINDSYILDITNDKDKDTYIKINGKEFIEDEQIIASFEKELNNSKNKIETLKKIKIKIDDNGNEKQKEYFNFFTLLVISEYIENRIKVTELLKNSLKSSNEEVKNILKDIYIEKKYTFDFSKIEEALQKIKKNKDLSESDKKTFQFIQEKISNLDVSDFLYFKQKNELNDIVKSIYKKKDDFFSSFSLLRNQKGEFDFLKIKDERVFNFKEDFIGEISKYCKIEKISYFSQGNKNIYKNLDILDVMEKESGIKNGKDVHSENLVYISISKILLLAEALQNGEKDLQRFSKYFFNQEKMKNTVSSLIEFLGQGNKLNKLEFPIDFQKLFYSLDKNLKEIIVKYVEENDIPYKKDSVFLNDIYYQMKDVFNRGSSIVKDYVLLKRFFIENYNSLDENIKKIVNTHGFKQLFLDFNSLKSNELIEQFKKTLPPQSFLLKSNIDKLSFIEENLKENKHKTLEYDKLLAELKLFQYLNIVNIFLNKKENILECEKFFSSHDSFLEFIEKLEKIFDKNDDLRKSVQNGIDSLKGDDILLYKHSKIHFFNNDLKNLFSKTLKTELKTEFNNFVEIDSFDLKLLPNITKEDDKFKIRHFMNYTLEDLKNEDNIILQLRTRYAQMAFMTLKIPLDILNNKFSYKRYEPYFEKSEDLKEFVSLVNGNILDKKDETIVVNELQSSLSQFIEANDMNIEELINNFHGYIPGGVISEFFLNEIKRLAKNKEYLLDILGITNKGKISYAFSLMTPEIIVGDMEEEKSGMVTGYNLRVTNKKELDRERMLNIFNNYFNGIQKNELLKVMNLKDEYNFNKKINSILLNELKDILNKVNEILTNKGIFTMDFIEVPKEPASKKIFPNIVELRESSVLAKIPAMFANIISIRNMDVNKPITIHINEGCKDAMSLESLLKYSENKNQFCIPLQGTQGFKYEFEELLFNLPTEQTITLKLWADFDYAGISLVKDMSDILEKYPNVKLVSMQELPFKTTLSKQLESKEFKELKGSDLTDWSLMLNSEKKSKEQQMKLIDGFNKEFNFENETFSTIVLESIRIELQKWDAMELDNKQKIQKINSFLESVGRRLEDFPTLESFVQSKYIDVKESGIFKN